MQFINRKICDYSKCNLTNKSTIKGANTPPKFAIVELKPDAVFLFDVGNSSKVCKMTTANTPLINKRPTSEITIKAIAYSENKFPVKHFLIHYLISIFNII